MQKLSCGLKHGLLRQRAAAPEATLGLSKRAAQLLAAAGLQAVETKDSRLKTPCDVAPLLAHPAGGHQGHQSSLLVLSIEEVGHAARHDVVREVRHDFASASKTSPASPNSECLSLKRLKPAGNGFGALMESKEPNRMLVLR